jgi:hypothetical protein
LFDYLEKIIPHVGVAVKEGGHGFNVSPLARGLSRARRGRDREGVLRETQRGFLKIN